MTISTNYNPSVLMAQKSLANSTNALNLALYRMSTGYKVNCAADDAAGLYVATGMGTQINGLLQARRNTQDGISMLNTSMGSLSNMTSILDRLRELSVQASSNVYSSEQRDAMKKEAEALTQQLYQIKNGTSFNGTSVFGAAETPTLATTLSLGGGGGVISSLKGASYKIKDVPKSEPEPSSTDEPQLSESQMNAIMSGYKATAMAAGESGNIDFTGNQSQTVSIDGKQYTIQNKLSRAQQLTYSVGDDGVLQFIGSDFSITGQADVAHNLDILGRGNTIRTGSLDDNITCSLTGTVGEANVVYGGAGNDTILMNGLSSTAYGEDGDDTITYLPTAYGTIYGGNGDDVINVNHYATSVRAGDGNDIINYNATSSYGASGLWGEGGDDTFNIIKGTNVYLNGGGGMNTVVDGGTETIKANVVGANVFAESFATNETRDIIINGIKYTVKNNTSAQDFVWQIDGSRIRFITSNFTITGEADKAHDVRLSGISQIFYGGDLSDKIYADSNSCTIYAGDGDDEISGGGWAYAYGEGGNDRISGGGNSGAFAFAYGGDGDDIITTSSLNYVAYGGLGNDTFNINGSNSGHNQTIYGEDGDDVFNVNSGSYVALFGGSGNNLLSKNSGVETQYSNMSNVIDNMTEIAFTSANETKTVIINGIEYTVKNLANRGNLSKSIGYSFNSVTGEVTFSGVGFEIVGDQNKAHNVRLNGRELTFRGGNLDDRINALTNNNTIYAGAGNDYIEHNGSYYNTIYAGDGDDEIVLNRRNDYLVDGGAGDDKITIKGTANNVQGGDGNDHYIIDGTGVTINDSIGSNIYDVNGTNNNITGGSGMDTFYVNGGNNVVRGGGGNDYIVINGDGNTIDGGPGDNLVVDNGTGNSSINVSPDPNSGILYFNTVGQTQTILLNGRIYTIKNTTTEGSSTASNQLKYNFNSITGEIGFEGNNFTIESESGFAHNLIIKGNNNVVGGAELNDKIVVSSGSGNRVLGGAGNDSIIVNSANNKVQGGDGDDNITINASQGNNLIDGEGGDDKITVNANNSTNVQGGAGSDSIRLNGSGNAADGGSGNDSLIAVGSNNTLTSSSGNNRFGASGQNNTLTGGSGNDVFTVEGSLNEVNGVAGKNEINLVGDSNTVNGGLNSDSINSKGDRNLINSGAGDDNLSINGSNNIVSSDSGNNRFTVSGGNNTLTGGTGNDDFTVTRTSKDTVLDGGAGDNTMSNYGKDTVFSNVRDITPDFQEYRLQIGANSDAYSNITVETGFNLGGFSVDFSSAESSVESMKEIDEIISLIQSKNSDLGAVYNRLQSVLDSQTIQIENLTAARSTILDADIAVEHSTFIRSQILQNTSAALLSQAQKNNMNLLLRLIQ